MHKLLLAGAMMAAFSATIPAPALASSHDAWAAIDREVAAACIAASGLPEPKLLTQKISFSDEIGVEVRLLRGSDEHGKLQRLICAYHRKTGRAEVREAVRPLAPETP